MQSWGVRFTWFDCKRTSNSLNLFPKIFETLSFFLRLGHLDESLGLSLHSNGFASTLFLCVLGYLAFTDWLGPCPLASSTFYSFFKDGRLFWFSSFLPCHLIWSYYYSPTLPSNKIILPCFALCIFYRSTKMLKLPISSHFDRTSFIWKKSILFSSAHSTKLVFHVRLKGGWLVDFVK